MDDLHDAVRRLTQPAEVPTLQTADGRAWVTVIPHQPLLTQLAAAAVGATGQHAGTTASGLDSTRLPFNLNAAALRDEITATLTGWGVGRPTGPTLPEWVAARTDEHTRGDLPEPHWRHIVTQLRSWVDRIEALFNPPTTVPLDAPCPTCNHRWGQEPVHGDRVDALAVLYTPTPGAVTKVHAICRHCDTVWFGRAGLRTLIERISAAEQADRNTPPTRTPSSQ